MRNQSIYHDLAVLATAISQVEASMSKAILYRNSSQRTFELVN